MTGWVSKANKVQASTGRPFNSKYCFGAVLPILLPSPPAVTSAAQTIEQLHYLEVWELVEGIYHKTIHQMLDFQHEYHIFQEISSMARSLLSTLSRGNVKGHNIAVGGSVGSARINPVSDA
jgi:hypothetical protein